MNKTDFLLPDWPAPDNVACIVTTRRGEGFNLATHVGDNEAKVILNRKKLQAEIGMDEAVQWVNQVHGTEVFCPDDVNEKRVPDADAIFTTESNKACGILTADCLPVFFCDSSGKEVAVAHAGWRGLVAGVLENTVSAFGAKPEQIMAWLGPAIGPCHFEVGPEVREAFINAAPVSTQGDIESSFVPSVNPGKWMGDLYQLACVRLSVLGLHQVYGGGFCTYCESDKFYSYRRNKETGRFASLIWRKEP